VDAVSAPILTLASISLLPPRQTVVLLNFPGSSLSHRHRYVRCCGSAGRIIDSGGASHRV